jgi:hypothetical protein
VIYYRYAFHPNSASTKTGAAIQSGRLVHSLPDTNARSARLKGMGEGAAGQRAGTAAYDAPYFAAACTAGRERKCGITSSPTIRYCSTILSSGVPHPFARGLLADAEIGRHFDGPLTGTNAASHQESTIGNGARIVLWMFIRSLSQRRSAEGPGLPRDRLAAVRAALA